MRRTNPPPRPTRTVTLLAICLCELLVGLPASARCAEPTANKLADEFLNSVQPFLQSHCLDCHGGDEPEAMLDLSRFASADDVSRAHAVWAIVLERLETHEMPPQEAAQPSDAQRDAIIGWIKALRSFDANRHAGDPGPVLARRLSNAEYNHSIRDLTGVDIQPTKTFPIDPANEAGFDNSGESLSMSPALFNKYLEAARNVAEHLVLTPSGLSFAPHPAVTDVDRDKYCVKRIVEFYLQQPTDLADYFYVCWKYQHVADRELNELANKARISPKYARLVWELLNDEKAAGPIENLQTMFRDLSAEENLTDVFAGCEAMRDYVLELRPHLSPKFDNLSIEGVHKGSQPFVLWKNEQYAAHRRTLDRDAFYVSGDELPNGTPAELVLPEGEVAQADYLAAMERFCSVFPDAFYISERGRDYLDVAKEKQEKGRLLSAGFHSMMGYFRDDAPLMELILDEGQRRTLDRLWQELDVVASAPARQYVGFLWFERTDSRFMRDPEFDFARAEDKDAASQPMIERLAEVYLEKARNSGGQAIPLQAIEDFFTNMNAQLRWVESERLKAEPLHLQHLLEFASRAWRRRLTASEQDKILAFYKLLRDEEHLDHEEALRDSLVSLLMSPHFMYRMDLANSGGEPRRLDGSELASRLSFFLWAAPPDDELLQLAEGQLDDPQVLAAQVERMLGDDRVRGLATEFAANWLDFRRFEAHNSVDRQRFPEFTDALRQAMFEEPIRLFVEVVRHDRSVLELLDADYTFVNAVLAKHYGFEGVEFVSDEWLRVEAADQYDRGGLLPMSVFLTMNAPGLRTSPVKRGYWVVRRLLGEHIPPPPPNVPELPADESSLGELTLPEILARHRAHQSCAGCHDRFDAIGLAFEGFGPVGERRDVDLGGRTVEVAAVFPGGTEGSGLAGLRNYLREHRQQDFTENLCRMLLSYGLGRTLILSDEALVADMQLRLEAGGYRMSILIDAIVGSQQFLNKRGGDKSL